MMDKTRILLADDHAMLRSGLRLLLNAQPDLEVVGEASDGREAIARAKALQPDVLLLDLNMPGLGGLTALGALRTAAPNARLLVLTMHDDENYLRQALKGGAAGYVLKRAADTELLSAVRAVVRGEVYIHPAMTRALLEDLIPEHAGEVADAWDSLSGREQDVLRLVALGHTSQEIADRLFLSVKTVETYRARGMEKLGLRSRAALVQYVLQRGLLDDVQ